VIRTPGVTVKIVGSLLVNETPTGEATATGRITEKDADLPCPTAPLESKVSAPAVATVTLADASGIPGRSLAWMVAVPAPTLVTGTVTLVAPEGKLMLGCTVNTVGSLELKLIVNPGAGAGADRCSVRLCTVKPVIVVLGLSKDSVAFTLTRSLSDANPGAEAVIPADPSLSPVTWGCEVGKVCPAGIVTVVASRLTVEASSLAKVTVRPPAGAGDDRLTAKSVGWLSDTVMPVGKVIAPKFDTVTFAVASGRLGRRLAWITADPALTPITAKVPVVLPAGNVMLAGIVTIPLGFAERLTTTPLAGAGLLSVRLPVVVLPTFRVPAGSVIETL
jgi:hypothetical protein